MTLVRNTLQVCSLTFKAYYAIIMQYYASRIRLGNDKHSSFLPHAEKSLSNISKKILRLTLKIESDKPSV
jgi:hypothetical protein